MTAAGQAMVVGLSALRKPSLALPDCRSFLLLVAMDLLLIAMHLLLVAFCHYLFQMDCCNF